MKQMLYHIVSRFVTSNETIQELRVIINQLVRSDVVTEKMLSGKKFSLTTQNN